MATKFFVKEDDPGQIVGLLRETEDGSFFERFDLDTLSWVKDGDWAARMLSGDPDFRSATEQEAVAFVRAKS